MKRLLILILLICGIYFTQSMLIANENNTDKNIRIEQIKDIPQVKNCCKDVKVGEKCPVCGKIKKACCKKDIKACCCKNTKVGEKCSKCGKVKKACPANCKKECSKKNVKTSCCKNTKVGEKCSKCGKVKKACPANCKKKCCKKKTKARGCCAKEK